MVPPPAPRPPLPRTVVALGVVSLLTDASSEMIAPLLPAFLTGTLGGSATLLGAIEGTAAAVAALLRVVSGRWSDAAAARKPFVIAGYALAAAVRPLTALATAPWQVGAIRAADRVGKGLRGPPRDALLAGAVAAQDLGRAFGFHRAMDHLGAVIGPMIAFVALNAGGAEPRTVFALAAVPGMLAVLVAWLGVREPPPAIVVGPPRLRHDGVAVGESPGATGVGAATVARYAALMTVGAIGTVGDAFLILRAGELGLAVRWVAVLWAAHHVVKALASTPLGAWSDRVGRRAPLVAGWAVLAACAAGLAIAWAPWHAVALLLVLGLFSALTEGAESALVAELAPAARRGVAFGWVQGGRAAGALTGGVAIGALWDLGGGALAFGVAAAVAAGCGAAVARMRLA